MAKKRRPGNPQTNSSNKAKPSPSTQPTAHQVKRLDESEGTLQTMVDSHGPIPATSVSEPPGATLEQSLTRVESLLTKAARMFKEAEKRSREVKVQQDALKVTERDLNGTERDLKGRIAQAEADDRDLKDRKLAGDKREADIAEANLRLVERELEAKQGFVSEKKRVLGTIDDEVGRLCDARAQLETEIAERREEADSQEREAGAKWAAKEAQMRRDLDAEQVVERREKLASLGKLLSVERADAEAEWQTQVDRIRLALDTRESKLDDREEALRNSRNAQRAVELDLQTEQGILQEDIAGLDRKVKRLLEEQTEDLRHELRVLGQERDDARAKRDAYATEIQSRNELDRKLGDRRPDEILADLEAFEQQRDDLVRKLRARPDERAAERLNELERERSGWLEERAVLKGDLASAQGELSTRRLAAIELESLRKEKEALGVHKRLLDSAVDELRVQVDELTRQEDHRNPMTALTKLDEDEKLLAEVRTVAPINRATSTLRDFAVDLRHRIATGVEERTLYYAERDVRAFLGGLAMTRLMLLQGISGTGKTSLPLAFASAVGGGVEVVEVQAGWRDRQDLIGYYNAFHRHYYATNFLQALYRAGTPAFRDRPFIMVLDEINLSRPEQFFADFLSALEQPMSKRRLTLVNDPVSAPPKLMTEGRHLPIPPNVWFVGTANHDESTTEFADKTYDRAHVMEMPRNSEQARFTVEAKQDRAPISYEKLEAEFSLAIQSHEKKVHAATKWLRDASFAEDLEKRFRVGWGNRLEQQLGRYLPVVVEAGGSVGEAMDHLLVTKVFRKLEDRHDVRPSALETLKDQILEAWDKLDGENPPERCMALIDKEIATKKGEELE